jgi:hypothetical protein
VTTINLLLDRGLHRAVSVLDCPDHADRLEAVGHRLVKVGATLTASSALILGALYLGERIGYYLFGRIL